MGVLGLLLTFVAAGLSVRFRFAPVKLLPGMPPGIGFQQFAGQITVNASCPAAVFAWVCKAREPPTEGAAPTPVVMFLNGGPGSSTFLA